MSKFRPKSFYMVKGALYQVLITDDGISEDNEANCDPTERIIRIRPQYQGDELKEVLLHELAHAVMAETGIAISGISSQLEEVIAENFATSLVAMFDIQNKK